MRNINIEKDISNAKSVLIRQAKSRGIYENFGQREVNRLTDKCNAMFCSNAKRNELMKKVDEFDRWCMRFDNKMLKEAEK